MLHTLIDNKTEIKNHIIAAAQELIKTMLLVAQKYVTSIKGIHKQFF